MPERQCLRKTLEQSAGTEPCKSKGWDAAGKGAKVSLRDRALQAWNRKQDLSGTEPCRWKAHLAGGKATVEAGKATGRCSA